MSTGDLGASAPAVIGQKYAYATAALIVGIASFINLLGFEKAILAIVFGWMALRTSPEEPTLTHHRGWAKAGIALGVLQIVMITTILVLNYERILETIEALRGGA
ncbi:MAG: DUF4190 domain-containing protein [Bryobacteraceae bacterium]